TVPAFRSVRILRHSRFCMRNRLCRCRRSQVFSICLSSSSRYRLQKFAMTAGAACRSASGYRRRCGTTLRKTNSIRNGETENQLMDKENQLSEAIEAALDKKAQDAVVLELNEICSFTD